MPIILKCCYYLFEFNKTVPNCIIKKKYFLERKKPKVTFSKKCHIKIECLNYRAQLGAIVQVTECHAWVSFGFVFWLSLLEGAVASWCNPADLWCQKLSVVRVRVQPH